MSSTNGDSQPPLPIGFALEYALGHITHAENLKAALAGEEAIRPAYTDIPYDNTPLPSPWNRVPGLFNNWTLRASLVAYHALRRMSPCPAAMFFHTQVTSLFSTGLMARIPSIVSLDATPVQYDALGAAYNHTVGAGPAETVKKRLNRRAFHAARRLITWSEWAKHSLVTDYGVPADRVTAIPPGIDLDRWRFSRKREKDQPLSLLFVGGDFERKGGGALLAAFERFGKRIPTAELHIVTKSPNAGDGKPGVVVHRGLSPNSPELQRLYAEADVFVFPTRGDCLPLAVLEALAAGLPVVTTDVGALSEAVSHEETGLIVPVDDPEALCDALDRLAENPAVRISMGDAARERASELFDARKNYKKIVESLKELAEYR